MADFDVEKYLEEQITKTSNEVAPAGKDSKTEKTSIVERRRSRSRSNDRRRRHSRSRSNDRRYRRDYERDSRDHYGGHRRRDNSREREHNRDRDRDRDRYRDKEREERSSDKERVPKVVEAPIDREELRRKKEIDDLTKDQRTLFVGQLVKKVTEKDLERFFGQIGAVKNIIMLRDKNTGVHKGFAYVEMDDLDSIPNCLLFNNVVPDFQKFEILVKASEAEKNFLAKKDPFSLKHKEELIKSGRKEELDSRVYVGNINVNIDESALMLILQQFGPVESLKLHRDNLGSKGFAFVKYQFYEHCLLAQTGLAGFELAGRPLKIGSVIDPGNQPPGSVGSSAGGATDSAYYTAASGNWKLDADDGGAGMALNSSSRVMLMAKLAQTAGMTVPSMVPAPPPMGVTYGSSGVGVASAPNGQPSIYFMISNMFDAATETNKDWHLDIQEDVTEECSNFGKVLQCVVERNKPGGIVFLKFENVDAANKAAFALHGRFFAGRNIVVTFLDASTYGNLVPSV